jgi:hypothetical protein
MRDLKVGKWYIFNSVGGGDDYYATYVLVKSNDYPAVMDVTACVVRTRDKNLKMTYYAQDTVESSKGLVECTLKDFKHLLSLVFTCNSIEVGQ